MKSRIQRRFHRRAIFENLLPFAVAPEYSLRLPGRIPCSGLNCTSGDHPGSPAHRLCPAQADDSRYDSVRILHYCFRIYRSGIPHNVSFVFRKDSSVLKHLFPVAAFPDFVIKTRAFQFAFQMIPKPAVFINSGRFVNHPGSPGELSAVLSCRRSYYEILVNQVSHYYILARPLCLYQSRVSTESVLQPGGHSRRTYPGEQIKNPDKVWIVRVYYESWASRIRTCKMTESESAALPFGYSPMCSQSAVCRLRIEIIVHDLQKSKHFFNIFLFLLSLRLLFRPARKRETGEEAIDPSPVSPVRGKCQARLLNMV